MLTRPRIFSTACCRDRPRTFSPSIWLTRSPARTPALEGWGVVNWCDYLDQFIFHGDFNPKAAKFALGLLAHGVAFLEIKVRRVRIERLQHAVDCAFDELLLFRLGYVLRAYPFKNVAKDVELTIGFGPGSIGAGCKIRALIYCNRRKRTKWPLQSSALRFCESYFETFLRAPLGVGLSLRALADGPPGGRIDRFSIAAQLYR